MRGTAMGSNVEGYIRELEGEIGGSGLWSACVAIIVTRLRAAIEADREEGIEGWRTVTAGVDDSGTVMWHPDKPPPSNMKRVKIMVQSETGEV